MSQFEGSIAIVAARGLHEDDPAAPITTLLVPVTGNENARRGAEMAIMLGKSSKAEVLALSIIEKGAKNKQQLRRETQAVSDEIEKIASYLKARIKTTTRSDDDAGAAILQALEREKSDLVVVGVSRRPGEKLSFGGIADTLLKEAKCSLLFIAPQARAAAKSSGKGGEEPAAAG